MAAVSSALVNHTCHALDKHTCHAWCCACLEGIPSVVFVCVCVRVSVYPTARLLLAFPARMSTASHSRHLCGTCDKVCVRWSSGVAYVGCVVVAAARETRAVQKMKKKKDRWMAGA